MTYRRSKSGLTAGVEQFDVPAIALGVGVSSSIVAGAILIGELFAGGLFGPLAGALVTTLASRRFEGEFSDAGVTAVLGGLLVPAVLVCTMIFSTNSSVAALSWILTLDLAMYAIAFLVTFLPAIGVLGVIIGFLTTMAKRSMGW